MSAQPAAFVPRFLDGTPHAPLRGDAYVHVRLADVEQPSTAMTVYLPNGTALVVSRCHVVTLSPSTQETG